MRGLNDLFTNYSTTDFAGILWYGTQTGGPHGYRRYLWYAGDGAPVAYFDGGSRVLGGYSSGSLYNLYYPRVNQSLAVSSPLIMDFYYYLETPLKGSVFGTIRVDETMAAGSKEVHLVVVEDNAGGSPTQRNLARSFYDGFEDFLLTDVGEEAEVIRNFTNLSSWGSDLEYIVFVQNMGTKEVLQAIQATSSSVPAIEVGVEAINSPAGDQPAGSYPANVTIANDGAWDQVDIPVTCHIYHDTTRIVRTLAEVPDGAGFQIPAEQSLGISQKDETIVYAVSTWVDINAQEQTTFDFSPDWNVSTAGEYRIIVFTGLPGDYSSENNEAISVVQIGP